MNFCLVTKYALVPLKKISLMSEILIELAKNIYIPYRTSEHCHTLYGSIWHRHVVGMLEIVIMSYLAHSCTTQVPI